MVDETQKLAREGFSQEKLRSQNDSELVMHDRISAGNYDSKRIILLFKFV